MTTNYLVCNIEDTNNYRFGKENVSLFFHRQQNKGPDTPST